MRCLLCISASLKLFYVTNHMPWPLYNILDATMPKEMRFFKCQICKLVFKDPDIRISKDIERMHYLKHNNKIDDPEYCNYLLKMVMPIKDILRKSFKLLDFGCGASPVLATILEKKGLQVDSYDKFFYPNTEIKKSYYDIIFMSEVAEHFDNPYAEFKDIFSALKPNGKLVLRTKVLPKRDFGNWWYMRDPTHLVFYSEETFRYLAKLYLAKFEEHKGDIYIFTLCMSE